MCQGLGFWWWMTLLIVSSHLFWGANPFQYSLSEFLGVLPFLKFPNCLLSCHRLLSVSLLFLFLPFTLIISPHKSSITLLSGWFPILCWFHHHHSLLNNLQWFPIIHRMKYNSVVWHWRLSTLLSPLWVTLASLLPYVNSWLECVRLFTDPQKAHLEPRSYLHALVLAIRSPEMPANHTVLYLSCPSFRLTSAWPFGASSLTAPVLCDYFPFLYFITHFLKTTHLGLRIFLYY